MSVEPQYVVTLPDGLEHDSLGRLTLTKPEAEALHHDLGRALGIVSAPVAAPSYDVTADNGWEPPVAQKAEDLLDSGSPAQTLDLASIAARQALQAQAAVRAAENASRIPRQPPGTSGGSSLGSGHRRPR